MKRRFILTVLSVVIFLIAAPLRAANAPTTAATEGKERTEDLTELNKKLTNPISDLWSDGWSIGYSGNVLANWKAGSAGDTWTVPLGLGIDKVVKLGPLPIKFGLAGQYMVHHPDIGGQKWNIQLTVAPVLPKLIKGSLLD